MHGFTTHGTGGLGGVFHTVEAQAAVIAYVFGGHTGGASGAHFTLTHNSREVGTYDYRHDSTADPQGTTRNYTPGAIPTTDANGNPIADFITHVSKHGQFDVLEALRKLARPWDLLQLDYLRPGMDAVKRLEPKILDWEATAPIATGVKPSGYYLNQDGTPANGYTTIIRTYMQIGKREFFGKDAKGKRRILSEPKFDSKAHTFVEVTIIIWRYYETADYETRFQVRVMFQPEISGNNYEWGYREAPFNAHQKLALDLCEKMFSLLSNCPPSELSVKLRKLVIAPTQPVTNDPQDAHPASPAEEAEAKFEDVVRDSAQDTQTAIDFETGATTPTTVTPETVGDQEGDEEGDLTIPLGDS